MNRKLRLTAAIGAGVFLLSAVPAQAVAPSSDTGVRLRAAGRSATVSVYTDGDSRYAYLDLPLYVESRQNRLEFDVRRNGYGRPIGATVHVGNRERSVPRRLLDGWSGLAKAFTLTWRTSAGRFVSRGSVSWCPNAASRGRLSPSAAPTTAFVNSCGGHPFTVSQRWGIDRGWAVRVPLESVEETGRNGVTPPEVLGDRARLEVAMRPELATLLGIPRSHRSARFDITIEHVQDDELGHDGNGRANVDDQRASLDNVVHADSSRHRQTAPSAPRDGRVAGARRRIARAVLPDLVSLPAFGFGTHSERGRDLLDFAATVYNGGRGPLVVEGFRRGAKRQMDAYQFFYRNSRQVGSAKVGSMDYDTRDSHQHWHFRDFATYDLVDRRHRRLRTSGKEAFCLAPTDGIDLLKPGAAVDPGDGDLETACGDEASIWVREVLASGWGDTYSQDRAGQSIDITGLPNGTYWVRVSANPVRRLQETSVRNNKSYRRVILGGQPGDRTVRVPRFGLVDSDTGAFGDGFRLK